MRNELGPTRARLFAYLSAIALIAIGAEGFLDVAEVRAAVEPSAPPNWATQKRPYRAFALHSPNLPKADYAIRRHAAGGRKDIKIS
ncbi:MAG: hypothetical protein GEU95_19415 [Rhizobiales bacterium]|nr:hypothetical protein [Hyphomicrobiales bacterium]